MRFLHRFFFRSPTAIPYDPEPIARTASALRHAHERRAENERQLRKGARK